MYGIKLKTSKPKKIEKLDCTFNFYLMLHTFLNRYFYVINFHPGGDWAILKCPKRIPLTP